MKVVPAILISNLEEFERQLSLYSEFTEYIDLDINVAGDDFKGIVTIDLNSILQIILKKKYHFLTCNFHLMVTRPHEQIRLIQDSGINFGKIYIHQEADLSKVTKQPFLGIAIKAESELKNIEYYLQYSEVQLMTIETGAQGNPIKPEVLERANWLRNKGFEGIISIDGGVNEKTVELIKKYPIDKVSVGSFLSKAIDPKANYAKLVELLKS